MAAKRPKVPAQSVPASKPRNLVAANPLLKKSGTHADRRVRVRLREDLLAIELAKAPHSGGSHNERDDE
jgi:hypothetical protein